VNVGNQNLALTNGNHPPSVMIATPMYGGMCSGYYTIGIIGAMAALGEAGCKVYFANIMNESLITRARNELARQFLASDYDYLMFVDSDIAFAGDSILRLLSAKKDIVCGIYPRKEIFWEGVRAAAQRGEGNLREHSGLFAMNLPLGTTHANPDNDGLIEVQHGATGFMLINRTVFEKLSPVVPQYRTSGAVGPDGEFLHPLTREFFATSIDERTNVLLSEDYHFCEKWRELGGRIFAIPSIKLEHVGSYVYGGDPLPSLKGSRQVSQVRRQYPSGSI
jgi:hypothetical protein